MNLDEVQPAAYQYRVIDTVGIHGLVECNYELYLCYKATTENKHWAMPYRYEVRRLYSEFDLKD